MKIPSICSTAICRKEDIDKRPSEMAVMFFMSRFDTIHINHLTIKKGSERLCDKKKS